MAAPSPPCLLRVLLPVASSSSRGLRRRRRPTTSLLRCSSPSADTASSSGEGGREYEPSFADDFLHAFFRAKMVEEVGWDSEKPGYTGLIEVANRPMVKGKSALEIEQSAVRVLRSLIPPLLLVLLKALVVPIANGQLASMMVVHGHYVMETVRCSLRSANIWKRANDLTFFKDHIGVDLYMEPNFEDYSCQKPEMLSE
ncbi:hypothetical protein OsJ_17005 [Oryza sativa Japonica Group]|uniref:Beta-carotene isomerase D27-like C-terminal domain-containing protein n=1 Tax=Oryza sativa subsp. japonica TaxID=39947 RepID=B9FMA5_ORYSJ|nr:hypothetical protein OsJ_17005 [Oryza sativa Japonica Group]